jgi:hypothetical protein
MEQLKKNSSAENKVGAINIGWLETVANQS